MVLNAANKLGVTLENGVAELISRYTIEGRKAVNILTDAYGFSDHSNNSNCKDGVSITLKDIEEVISIGRYVPFERSKDENEYEVGHIYGLG